MAASLTCSAVVAVIDGERPAARRVGAVERDAHPEQGLGPMPPVVVPAQNHPAEERGEQKWEESAEEASARRSGGADWG